MMVVIGCQISYQIPKSFFCLTGQTHLSTKNEVFTLIIIE